MGDEIRTGTHVIIRKGNKILLGKRKKKLGFGQWELPGGHVGFQESFEGCLERECEEELGIKVKLGNLLSVSPNMYLSNHYIVFTFEATSFKGTPRLKEPDKHQEWKWFDLNHLPQELFISTKYALEDFLSGKIYQKRSHSKR
jgi:8-oxo-dGTP diphosphatase